jgi:uncharacterized protein YbjT (DUF2867 family)
VNVFITGGTGYIGSRLVPALVERRHKVKALVRKASGAKLPIGAEGVIADALRVNSYTSEIPPAETFVHLIGVPHPSPMKAAQFRAIDLVSIRVAIKAARDAGIGHFIYLSVAQPAPVMRTFLEVRRTGEEMIRASGMPATFVRPWYVLGPGHRWPYPLLPFFRLLEWLPATRETAQRLGFITIEQMLKTLVWAVENPPDAVRIIGVPRIRELGRLSEVRLPA